MTGDAARAVGVVLATLAIPALAASTYLALLALLARRERRAPASASPVKFDVVVPAHDEEAGIAATIANLLALDYPRELYRVVVVADNCSDRTADVARAARAVVLERRDPNLRGKGYALQFAYQASLAHRFADAVVVVDADTVASSNLLSALAARIGGSGAEALQVEYGVRNPTESWRTRLMVIAFTLFHTVRSLARERLGLSSGLRGNGMCFAVGLLRRVPHRAFSVVEDIEYGVALGLAGVRVEYVDEASVRGEMPATTQASRSQRARWEQGRWELVRRYVPSLLRTAVRRRDRISLDLAADLLVPPLTTLVGASVVGTALALLACFRFGASPAAALLWGASLLGLLVYVGRGIALSGLGGRAVVDLMWAPVYALWKVGLLLRPERQAGWVRTSRRSEP